MAALKACSALLAYLSMDAAGMNFRSLVQPALQVNDVMRHSCIRVCGVVTLEDVTRFVRDVSGRYIVLVSGIAKSIHSYYETCAPTHGIV